jgi:hypothetical protein
MRIRHLLAMFALATTLFATGCCWCGHRFACRRAYSAPCCECAPTCCYKPAEPVSSPHAP